MDRVLGPMSNVLSRLSLLVGGLTAVLGVIAGFVFAQKSRWTNRVGVPVRQPVPFSHTHHVAGLGIDCRYCHSSVGDSAFAGMPSAETCMHCHAQLYTTAEVLEPVREAWRRGVSLRWRRVHDLPDFVFFNHATHVDAGVSCVTCHGDVGRMPATWKSEPIDMLWCLDCHRHPETIRPEAPSVPSETAPPLNPERAANPVLTNCSACHR